MKDKKIETILKRFGLTQKGSPLSRTSRFLVLRVGNKEDYALKHQLELDRIASHLFQKELFSLRYLASQKELAPFFGNGKLLAFEDQKKPYWYLFDFIEGKKGGETLEDQGFKKEFLTDGFSQALLKFFSALHQGKNTQAFRDFLKPTKILSEDVRGGDWFQKEFDARKDFLQFGFSRREIKEAASFILKRKELIGKHSYFLAHDDLVPKHTIFTRYGFCLIDWEHLVLANPGFNLAWVYLHGWRRPAWREKLVFLFRTSQKDKKLFDDLFAASLVLKGVQILTYLQKKERLTKEVLSVHKASILKALK